MIQLQVQLHLLLYTDPESGEDRFKAVAKPIGAKGDSEEDFEDVTNQYTVTAATDGEGRTGFLVLREPCCCEEKVEE